jgi:hypothetical protein
LTLELHEQFFGFVAGVEEAFVPGDADFSTVFREPGGSMRVAQSWRSDFGDYGEEGGGDS